MASISHRVQARDPVAKRKWTEILFGRQTVFMLGLVVFALLPIIGNPYHVYVGNLALIYVLLAVGLNILLGFAGQLAFAGGALFGIATYATGLLRLDLGVPFWLAMPMATVFTAAFGLLIALPALRLKSLYLALATVAFAQFTLWVFLHWDAVTHGSAGFVMDPIDFSAIGVSTSIGIYYLSLLLVIAFVFIAYGIMRSRVGRAFVAVRESEVAAGSIGVDIIRYKIIAYGVSALYAGVAGGLFAGLLNVVVPESFNLFQVVLQFGMVVVGGIGSVAGSIIGAVLLVLLQEGLRGLQEVQEIGLGLLLLLTLRFFPGGIAQALRTWVPGWYEPHHRQGRIL
ncbi:branched-chain amino acid transport system permease protein [Rhodoligotrophos appendicifer]|uniref:branched-chain amino acid ABC transporter permease n=1 Tax=Rhodoligotrophos appendicifer TaxID=987056 RepID=UPI0011870A88|nr:branched-chain amino acid ABC transporter permease [Rhodoligotrophos appendicifer]